MTRARLAEIMGRLTPQDAADLATYIDALEKLLDEWDRALGKFGKPGGWRRELGIGEE